MTFHPHPDFNVNGKSLHSKGVCPVTGLPRQKYDHNAPATGQVHEDFILRGPEILFNDGRGERSLGHFDVRIAAIRDAAKRHLGMVDGEHYADLLHDHNARVQEVSSLKQEADSLRDQVRAMVLGNAELIVQNEATQNELAQAYEELYGEDYDSVDALDLPDDELDSLDALAEQESL